MAKRIVYISGPITGTDNYQEKFQKAEEMLLLEGFEVINHARLDKVLHKSASHKDYMDVCLKLLERATHIYLLKGWGDSKGATQEKKYAIYLGLKIMFEYPKGITL